MSVRSVLYVPAFVFLAIALLIIVACGAIVTVLCRGRRSRFSYFAGGMTAKITGEDDIAQSLVSVV
jgi:hypothetical protein